MADRLAELRAAARKLALGAVCCGQAAPGLVSLSGNSFESSSGEWWVVDGQAWDRLQSAWSQASAQREMLTPNEGVWLSRLEPAIDAMCRHVILCGSGPVAPAFDDFDAVVESRRGRWFVIEGKAFPEYQKIVNALNDTV